MSRQSLDDLVAFLAVARAGSFTHAAPEFGVSQCALSHTIRALEAQLGVRLLSRTTRSVAPTEAGERLLRALGPRFEEIEAELAAVRDPRDKPIGRLLQLRVQYLHQVFQVVQSALDLVPLAHAINASGQILHEGPGVDPVHGAFSPQTA
jgi:DNA-binding transcriptional LysR family regulator